MQASSLNILVLGTGLVNYVCKGTADLKGAVNLSLWDKSFLCELVCLRQ